MSDAVVTAVVSLCVFGGAVLGMVLNRVLPPHHMSDETRQVVNVAVGLIATLAALVLGLMVASAKASFDARSDEVKQSAARIVMLDRSLRQYGPEAAPALDLLHDLVRRELLVTWEESASPDVREGKHAASTGIVKFQTLIRHLKPADEAQRWLQARALKLSAELEETRWLLLESGGSSIQRPFLVVLVLWLTVIFTSLGLFAPRHRTALAVIVICALSVSTAIFLILEMDQPFSGLMQVSDEPLRAAIRQVGR